jgi:hypothetical protein
METVSDCMTIVSACGEEYRHATPDEVISASDDVRRDYRNGHYFDTSTLRFFGSRNFATVAPGASVELQTNAPGDRYRVTIWKSGTDRSPKPWFGCRHATRREAVKCARDTSDMLWDAELANVI